jgi:hypothetical protein
MPNDESGRRIFRLKDMALRMRSVCVIIGNDGQRDGYFLWPIAHMVSCDAGNVYCFTWRKIKRGSVALSFGVPLRPPQSTVGHVVFTLIYSDHAFVQGWKYGYRLAPLELHEQGGVLVNMKWGDAIGRCDKHYSMASSAFLPDRRSRTNWSTFANNAR